eukprot:PhF_6_TR35174/c0_g1_i1/m.51240
MMRTTKSFRGKNNTNTSNQLVVESQQQQQQDIDAAWRNAYIMKEAVADPATRPKSLPHRSLLEEYLREQQKKVNAANDKRLEIIAEYFGNETRAEAVHQYKLMNPGGPVHTARWRWGLLREVVLGGFHRIQQRQKNESFVNMLKKQVNANRIKTKRGPKPPIPPPIVPPFTDPERAFLDMVDYKRRVQDYLDTEWLPDEPLQTESQLAMNQSKVTLSMLSEAPVGHLSDDEREVLTGRTKLDRSRTFDNYVRAKSAMSVQKSRNVQSPTFMYSGTRGSAKIKSRVNTYQKPLQSVDWSHRGMKSSDEMLRAEPKGVLYVPAPGQKRIKDDDDVSSTDSDELQPTRAVGEVGVIRAKGVNYAYVQEQRSKVHKLVKKLKAGKIVNLDDEEEVVIRKYCGDRLLLQHNKLKSLGTTAAPWTHILGRRIVSWRNIAFLDLSNNYFDEVPECIGVTLVNLTTLWMHGNRIQLVRGFKHLFLGPIRDRLLDFTFHGNPVELKGNVTCRKILLVVAPHLRTLNFSKVLNSEVMNAHFLMQGHTIEEHFEQDQ